MASRLQQLAIPEREEISVANAGTGSRLNMLAGIPKVETRIEPKFSGVFPSTLETLEELKSDPLSLKQNPLEAVEAMWNTLSDTVKRSAPKILNLFKGGFVTAPFGITGIGLPGITKREEPSKEIGEKLEAVAAGGELAFSPITTLFEGANKVPVLGSVSRLVTLPFVAAGEGASAIGGKIVEELPIPEKDKENIKAGVQEIFALGAQLALGKITHIGTKKVKELKDRFGEKDTQTIIDKAQEVAEQAKEPVPAEVAEKVAPEAPKQAPSEVLPEKGIILQRAKRLPSFETIKDETFGPVTLKDEGNFVTLKINKETGMPLGRELVDTDKITTISISKNEWNAIKKTPQELKTLIKSKLGIPQEAKIVYHETGEQAYNRILKEGFKTGKELEVGEKRGAVYFAGKDVNPDLYSRNKVGELYVGQAGKKIPIDISNLELLDVTHADKEIRGISTRGELEKLPSQYDGTIEYLKDGSIYQVALKKEVANKLISTQSVKGVKEVKPEVPAKPTRKYIEVPREQLPVRIEGAEKGVSALEARMKGIFETKNVEKAKAEAEARGLDVSVYDKMSKPEQINAAAKFVERTSQKDVLDILAGKKEAPKGLLHNALMIALEEKSFRDKNIDTAIKLASLRSTRAGQEISILTEVAELNPVSGMDAIIRARSERAQRTMKTGETIRTKRAESVNQIKTEQSKLELKMLEAEKLLDSIVC